MNNTVKLVALAGPKFCGKTSVAKHLIEKHGFVKFSFADPLRAMLKVLGVTDEEMSDPVLKESPCAALGGASPRLALQQLGTEFIRDKLGKDILVNLAKKSLEAAKAAGSNVVLDDCRYDNEAKAWREAGGTVIELKRDGCSYNRSHRSEAGLSPSLISCRVQSGLLPHVIKDVEYIMDLLKDDYPGC